MRVPGRVSRNSNELGAVGVVKYTTQLTALATTVPGRVLPTTLAVVVAGGTHTAEVIVVVVVVVVLSGW